VYASEHFKIIVTCRCICGVLADKLVVLVTHQLQYAQHADSILVLKQVYPMTIDMTVYVKFLLHPFDYGTW